MSPSLTLLIILGYFGGRWIIEASAQAFVVSEQPFLAAGSSFTYYTQYYVAKGIYYISHSAKNFGAFSEYSIIYKPDVPRLFAEGTANYLPIA